MPKPSSAGQSTADPYNNALPSFNSGRDFTLGFGNTNTTARPLKNPALRPGLKNDLDLGICERF